VPRTAPSASLDLARSPLALAIVGLVIACYVVLFYTAQPFRLRSLLLAFLPGDVWDSWGLQGQVPGGFFDRLPLIAVAFGILGVAWASGSLFVRGWKLDRRLQRLETEIFSIGIGLSLWSTWTLLVGLLGLLHQTWLVWLPAILTASLAGFQMAARRIEADTSVPVKEKLRDDGLRPYVLLLGVPFALFYVFAAVLPPLDFDVIEYHLQVPKEWYQAGRITFLPHNVYGNMPLGAEMFALLGMTLVPGENGWWYGALIGKVLMALTSILTALLLYSAGRRVGSTTAGVVSALVYLSTPWIYLVSVSGRNEGVMAFYLALAVYGIWLWRRESDEVEPSLATQSHWLKLAGFFAGSAAAVKYTAVPFVVLPLLLAALLGHRRFDWRAGLVFTIGALAACGLWYAKNVALTGNPVYPLAANVFDSATRTPEKTAQWNAAHATPPVSEIGVETERLLLKSEWLSPLLVPLAALAVLATPYRRTTFWLAALLGFYLLCWFGFTHRIDRFWVPALVLVAWLAGLGATWSALGAWRHVLTALLFWGLVSNFLQFQNGGEATSAEEKLPLNFVTASLDSLKTITTSPGHRYLNEHVPRGYRVLLVGDAMPFNLQAPALYNTCFDDVWFDTLLKGRDRAARQAALREQKIAYVYVRWDEIDRYRRSYGYSDIRRKRFYEELVQRDKLLQPIAIEDQEPVHGELFEVIGAVPRPE
jgi:hypothetical protein